MPDPKLKAAAEEMKAVCKKYDIAALITLQGPATVEYVRVIDPSWSCARFESTPEGDGIRIRSKLAEYPSKGAQKDAVENTVGMIFGFHKQAGDDVSAMMQVLGLLGAHFPEIRNFMWDDSGRPHRPPEGGPLEGPIR